MLRKIIFAAGMGYLARRLMGGRRSAQNYPAGGTASTWGRRGW